MNTSGLRERIRGAAVTILVFAGMPSVALHNYLNIGVKAAFMVTTCGLLLVSRPRTVGRDAGRTLAFVLGLVTVFTLIAWLWSTLLSQLMMGTTLFAHIALTTLSAKENLDKASISLLYRFTVVILICSWIGVAYSLAGGGPTYCFQNPDLRENCLYLTTFSNGSLSSGLIRPAGIFDEPGALSFFTVLVVCLNELSNGGKTRSFILMTLGLVTLSMAHIFCFAAYAAFALRKRLAYAVVALTFVGGPIADFIAQQSDQDSPLVAFFDRFSVSDEGQLEGDTRSHQVTEFFSVVDYRVSRYGNNAMIKYDRGGMTVVDQSSHPFSIWFGYGFVIWIPYAITMFVLIRHVFQRDRRVQVVAVLMTLLLLQRPYIYSLYWGFAIWSVIAMMFFRKASLGARETALTSSPSNPGGQTHLLGPRLACRE